MANVYASCWNYNYWESLFDTGFQADFYVEDTIYDILAGEPSTLTDTYVAGWLYGGGNFSVSGRGFEYATRDEDVAISRMTATWPSGSFELVGNLHGGGYAGLQGYISYAKLIEGGDAFTVSGDLYISYYGDAYAYNATEEVALKSGIYVRSQTDAGGRYSQHYAQYQGNSLTIDGSWAYDSIYAMADLFEEDDTFNGTGGNDFLKGYAGNDHLMGGSGVDAAIFRGAMQDYSIQRLSSGEMSVSDLQPDRDGVDTLNSVERVMFLDRGMAFDVDGATSAGGIFRLYQATFDRVPDLGGLGYWIDRADNGRTAVAMAEDFVWSSEFQQLYGVTTHDQYLTGADITALVTGFYRNVLEREPDQGGLSFYVGVIHDQERTVGRVLAEIADSSENYVATIGQIQKGIQYDVWFG